MKRVPKPFLALSLQLALIMQLVFLAVAITWSDDLRLTEYSALDVYPAITQLSNGKIWVAWESNVMGNTDIVYMVYDWTNWSPPDLLTEDSNQDNAPSIFQARNGTIWLFWSSDRTGNFDIFYKTYNRSAWSRDIQLTSDPQNDGAPSAVQAIDGKVWVVWQRSLPGHDLFYTMYNGTWSEEYQLTDNPGDDNNPKLTQTADARIWVTWSSFQTGGFEIFYKIHNGLSWSTENRLTTSTNLDVLPSITQARDGAIWIVWTSGKSTPSANDDLYYKVSYDNGGSWSASIQLTTDVADDWWPSIAQISDKKLWVVWASNRNDNYDIYYKTSSEIIVHDVAISDVKPASTLSSQGQTVPINVTAQNKGDVSETFTVTCYINSTIIGSQGVTLGAGSSTTLTFQWNTTTFPVGKYVASASASSVPGENPVSTGDNTLQDDEIIIVVIRDRAILDVSPSRSSIAQGYVLKIQVTVKNEGTYTDTFDVTLKYDSTVIETKKVTDLSSNESKALIFQWNTSGVPFGTYTITASIAPAPYEKDLADNNQSGGSVRVKLPGDVDGDSEVDIADLSWIARAFGTDSSWPEGTDWDQWNPDADINNDNKVDVVDLYIAAANYGRTE